MSTLEFSESVRVDRSPAEVFAYLADFRRAREWRTEVRSTEMVPLGPMRVGSLLREVSVIAGRRVVTESEIEAYEEPYRIGFRHRTGPLPMHGVFEVRPTDGGAEVRYDLQVELGGGWALLSPAFRLTWPQRMVASLDELRYRLESTRVTHLSLAS